MKEILSDNKQETNHLRQEFDEMKSYMLMTFSNERITKVIYIDSLDILIT